MAQHRGGFCFGHHARAERGAERRRDQHVAGRFIAQRGAGHRLQSAQGWIADEVSTVLLADHD